MVKQWCRSVTICWFSMAQIWCGSKKRKSKVYYELLLQYLKLSNADIWNWDFDKNYGQAHWLWFNIESCQMNSATSMHKSSHSVFRSLEIMKYSNDADILAWCDYPTNRMKRSRMQNIRHIFSGNQELKACWLWIENMTLKWWLQVTMSCDAMLNADYDLLRWELFPFHHFPLSW